MDRRRRLLGSRIWRGRLLFVDFLRRRMDRRRLRLRCRWRDPLPATKHSFSEAAVNDDAGVACWQRPHSAVLWHYRSIVRDGDLFPSVPAIAADAAEAAATGAAKGGVTPPWYYYQYTEECRSLRLRFRFDSSPWSIDGTKIRDSYRRDEHLLLPEEGTIHSRRSNHEHPPSFP